MSGQNRATPRSGFVQPDSPRDCLRQPVTLNVSFFTFTQPKEFLCFKDLFQFHQLLCLLPSPQVVQQTHLGENLEFHSMMHKTLFQSVNIK